MPASSRPPPLPQESLPEQLEPPARSLPLRSVVTGMLTITATRTISSRETASSAGPAHGSRATTAECTLASEKYKEGGYAPSSCLAGLAETLRLLRRGPYAGAVLFDDSRSWLEHF